MHGLAMAAALAAAGCWAAGALLAHHPVRALGSFELTRIQLISSSGVLLVAVTARGGWASVSWDLWANLVAASVFGVVASNLLMFMCMRRAGPRRSQLLLGMNVPIAAGLGFTIYGIDIPAAKVGGMAIVFIGVMLAIGTGGANRSGGEPVHGSLLTVFLLGLGAAASNAIGLVSLKPVLDAGTDPLAATALRTCGGALLVSLAGLWPAQAFLPSATPSAALVVRAILPGLLGYCAAVGAQLYALQTLDVGIVAVLGSTAPVLMLPLIWVTTGTRPALAAWVGAGAAVIGTMLLFAG
jgi:drug/metabolite transporter (DMT)-like permease